MCGIFGFFTSADTEYRPDFVKNSLKKLALLSESRGMDSSGLVIWNEPERTVNVLKGAVSISYLLKRRDVTQPLDRAIDAACGSSNGHRGGVAVMGHSRLVTNGSQLRDVNNQPVIKDGVIGIHNGIIVNDRDLFSRHSDLRRSFEIDTEIMLALVGKYVHEGWGLASSVSKTVQELVGTVATAMYVSALNEFVLATNNGSLYLLTDGAKVLAFASEKYFITELAAAMQAQAGGQPFVIRQVEPGTGCVVSMAPFRIQAFTMAEAAKQAAAAPPAKSGPYRITEGLVADGRPQREMVLDVADIARQPAAHGESALLEHNVARIQALQRCATCLLPETFPFIEFDRERICNYCRHYQPKNQPKPIDELFELVKPYRRADGGPDCIIPYSGGRDSTFTLHIAKNILKLNPIAFTYDWGMVTDLARRNIARTCGKLGVENIIVSADIEWKRENIRRNILAWLHKPHLGMVPLFMAGDKFFFYYTARVKSQTGIRLNLWGINPLENTEFKVGFMGVPPDFHKERIYSLSRKRQTTLFVELGKVLLKNPRYLNRSVIDSIGSYCSRYLAPRRDYYHLFDYVRWDEAEIDRLLLNDYGWETAVDTKTTWRIGDGTAAFYNYVYYTVAGFSEYDTFRSNQIREGMISREEGERLALAENRPRYASLKWYTEIVGLDFPSTIKRINSIPKLYR
jgi:asparagine synthetase B (glutamine-hydrolysing)